MRKINLTKEQYDNIKIEAAKYQSKTRIANAIDINPLTFDSLLKTDPMVKYHFNEGRKIAIDIINHQLLKKLEQGDSKIILFLAEKFAGINEDAYKKEMSVFEYKDENMDEDREKTEKLRNLFLEFAKSKEKFKEWLENKEEFEEYIRWKQEAEGAE